MVKGKIIASFLVCSALIGCGRYGPPVPPSALAPETPKSTSARVEAPNTVVISWANPSNDRRGKGLLSLDGISIYRRKLPSVLEVSESASDWELVKEEKITNFAAKSQASSAPGPLAAVSTNAPKNESTNVQTLLEYRDTLPTIDGVYQYVLHASNQSGVEGDTSDIFQVSMFKNGTNEVVVIPNSKHKMPR